MKKLIVIILALLLGTMLLVGCSSQEETQAQYPDKEITLIIPWGAGGITDTVGRTFATSFEEAIGQPVTVVNVSGASGSIGTEQAYAADADGYTILFSAETPGVFNAMGTSELNFSNFDPVMMMVQDTKVVVVSKNSEYKTFEDLVAAIKADPGKIKMSYSSPGASGHIQGLALSNADLEVNLTPYGGGSDAMIAAISEEVEFTFGNYGTVKDYLETGELVALATFTESQVEFLPEVPPMTDALPQLESIFPLYFPNCILVKEGTPEDVTKVIRAAAEEAIASDSWNEFVANRNYTTLHDMSLEEIGSYWTKFTSITSWLLEDAGAAINNPEDYGIERYTGE